VEDALFVVMLKVSVKELVEVLVRVVLEVSVVEDNVVLEVSVVVDNVVLEVSVVLEEDSVEEVRPSQMSSHAVYASMGRSS